MKKTLTCALALAFLVAGCSKASQVGSGSESNSWTTPHVLTFADAGDVNTLNPHFGQYSGVGWISQLTMAWLIRWDEHNQPYPELATEIPTQHNGGVSADGKTITFHLRHGVKWADGAPLTADDVVWTTKVILDPQTNEVGREGWDQITKIDEPDKYTVVYHLRKPYSPFVETFFSTAGANPCILPKHLLAQYSNINNVPYNSMPVGIGPFKVQRWDRGQQVVLVANPNYWRGMPKLQKIVYKIVPDRNTLLSQIQAHEVDMWVLTTGAYWNELKQVAGYDTLDQPSYFWDHLDFNLQRPEFKDPIVREAIAMSLDRQEIIDKIRHGIGTMSDSPTPISAPYNVPVPPRAFDIAKANALLDGDGWQRGADGIRAKNGVKLNLVFAINSGSQDSDNEIELMRANWKKVGIALDVRHYPIAQMFAPLQQGGIVYGNSWDLILFAWQNEAIGDYSPIYGCQAIPPKGQNDPRWCDPKAQAALDSLYTHYDQAQRNADVKQFVDAFVADLPVFVLDQRRDLFAYNKDLKNFHPNGVSMFDNIMDVDI